MKHSKHVGLFIAIAFVGMSFVGFCSRSCSAEEWKGGFEAFKPATDAKYHQRNTGNIPVEFF